MMEKYDERKYESMKSMMKKSFNRTMFILNLHSEDQWQLVNRGRWGFKLAPFNMLKISKKYIANIN